MKSCSGHIASVEELRIPLTPTPEDERRKRESGPSDFLGSDVFGYILGPVLLVAFAFILVTQEVGGLRSTDPDDLEDMRQQYRDIQYDTIDTWGY